MYFLCVSHQKKQKKTRIEISLVSSGHQLRMLEQKEGKFLQNLDPKREIRSTFPPKEHNAHPLTREEGIPFGKEVVRLRLPVFFIRNPASMETFSQHTLCNYFLFSVTLFVANHMFFLRQ